MTTTPLPEEWEKQFDKKTQTTVPNGGFIDPSFASVEDITTQERKFINYPSIKVFIHSLLLQSYEQGKRDTLKEVEREVIGLEGICLEEELGKGHKNGRENCWYCAQEDLKATQRAGLDALQEGKKEGEG